MLSLDEIGDYIDARFTRTAFRLETLDRYGVASDGDDVSRYLAGEPVPTAASKGPWLDELRSNAAAGKVSQRVRVVYGPLTDYLRYECEWGYVYNVAAGENIRVLDLNEVRRPEALLDEDFWLMDDSHAALMRYDEDGCCLGGDPIEGDEVQRYRAARDASWAAAVPFTAWWEAHPYYWRVNQTV